jgi:uncharacterized membrane protein YkoI
MKNSKKVITSGLLGLLIAGTSAFAIASQNNDEQSAKLISEAVMTVDQAMSIALTEVPGKVTETEIEKEDGKLIWEVSVLDAQNRTFELEIDANSGEVLDIELDDD